MGKEYKRVKNAYRQWYEKGRLDLDVDGVKITGWNLAYMSNMTVHKDKKFKHVQQLVKKYISKYNIPADLESTLLELQNAYMTDFRNLDQYPLNKRFDYNIYDYIINDVELLNQPTAYRFEWNWDKNESWFQKYEKMFYQRRVPYTKTNVLPVHDK